MNHKYLSLLVLWMALIFYLSSIPHVGFGFEGYEEQFFRKSVHIIMYAILTFLLWFSIPKLDVRLSKKILLCAVLSILCAISDELHQSFVPGRCGNVKGVLFDLAGIVVALIWLGRKQRNALRALVKTSNGQH